MAICGWCHNISDSWIIFWQISGKIHFFPTKFFLPFHARKSKLRAQSIAFYKVYCSIYSMKSNTQRTLIYAVWMSFLGVFFEVKFLTVSLRIFENMLILMTLQPSILPVELNWAHHRFHRLNILRVTGMLFFRLQPHDVQSVKNNTENSYIRQ